MPILVNPALERGWSDYGEVTLIKANWTEAMEAADINTNRPRALVRRLSDEHHCHVCNSWSGWVDSC